MYATERQHEILDRTRVEGRVEVKALADALDVTPETVRRDLTALERRGLVRRVHGGAIPVDRQGFEPPLADRETRMAPEKDRIAQAALEELPDGGSIILDAGTTTIRLAQLIPAGLELTVVTHSLPVAMLLAHRPGIQLYVVGGLLRPRTLAAVGGWAQHALKDLTADVAFLGTNGITAEQGLTTPDLEEAQVKRALIGAARRTVVLADHTKVGRTEFAHVARLDVVDTFVTDRDVDAELAEDIEAAGPRVVRA